MPFRLPFPDIGRLGRPLSTQEAPAQVSLVPRAVSSANGITVDTPYPVHTSAAIEVPPYTAAGRTRSVKNGIMVDTPAVTVVTPDPRGPVDNALRALGYPTTMGRLR